MRASKIIVKYNLSINKFIFLQISIFWLARGEGAMNLSNGAAEQIVTMSFVAEAGEKKRRSHYCLKII